MRLKTIAVLMAALMMAWSWQARAEGGEIEYVKFKPFVVNYGGPEGRLQYLKVELQVAVRGIPAANTLEHHMPDVRNDLMMYLSSLSDEVVKAPDSREQIMEGALQVVRQAMELEINHPLAERVLIQNLVYQ